MAKILGASTPSVVPRLTAKAINDMTDEELMEELTKIQVIRSQPPTRARVAKVAKPVLDDDDVIL
jgi:hypothetical protein